MCLSSSKFSILVRRLGYINAEVLQEQFAIICWNEISFWFQWFDFCPGKGTANWELFINFQFPGFCLNPTPAYLTPQTINSQFSLSYCSANTVSPALVTYPGSRFSLCCCRTDPALSAKANYPTLWYKWFYYRTVLAPRGSAYGWVPESQRSNCFWGLALWCFSWRGILLW